MSDVKQCCVAADAVRKLPGPAALGALLGAPREAQHPGHLAQRAVFALI